SANTTGTGAPRYSSRNSPDRVSGLRAARRAGDRDGKDRALRLFEARRRRARFRALSRRARQAHLRLGEQGGLGGLDEAPDDARQRESPQSRRPARPPISGPPDGEFLFRR